MEFDPSAAFDPERFRREAREVVDWIADYWQSVGERPVQSQVEPGWVRSHLPPSAPERAETLDAVLADLDRVILPGLTHWQHPGFFAYFPASTGGPSMLGELLAAGLGTQGMLWSTSPACTELETLVLDWLRELLGLPERFAAGPARAGGGVIQDSASSGLLCAMVAARERATGHASNAEGLQREGPRLVVYASDDAHSSVEKAATIAGIGREWVRRIRTDAGGGMDAGLLAGAMAADADAGRSPCLVVATVGTTASGGIDPVPEVAATASRHGAWLHVDAAWAGAAAVCPEYRPAIVAGADRADSWGFNPHKWLLVNFDCHALWVADRDGLTRALTVRPDYLRNRATESGAVVDYSDWQVPLGRRFRALKLWMTLRMIGAEPLRARIRDHVRWATEFAAWVRADPRFILLREPSLGLVTFALHDGDEASRALLDRVNGRGTVFLSHATVAGRLALRLAIGGTLTERRHVESAWRELSDAAALRQTAGDPPPASRG
ncbi:MAG: aspartate aminotransferase family protein [Planctomycetia bacterium]|nr:aspartate aminotransferase family protein [Planctomycetia bacterium]